jgi:chromosome segregation ATPase
MKTLACALVLLSSAALSAEPDAWVVVRDDRSASMHGDLRDLEAARSHLRELGPGYLWFRHEGKEYVVRDGALLKEIDEAARPQEELGQAQGELGRRQGRLGRQQGELGREQGQLGEKQARVAMQRARREMSGEKADSADLEAERDVEETQRQLGKAQQVLGREQEKIGHEQEQMGRQQEKLSRAMQKKVQELIEASLKPAPPRRSTDRSGLPEARGPKPEAALTGSSASPTPRSAP